MTPQEEARFEKKAERELAGHRLPPNGRNFMAFNMREKSTTEAKQRYNDNFDTIFPNAPGAGI